MNIGEAAATTGVSAKMIRYYEATGLMPAVSRTDAGYRRYSGHGLHTLHFIRRARDLGFSMKQIRDLLDLWRDRSRSSAEVKRIAQAHIAELEDTARKLQEMAETLQHLADNCHGDHRPDCPILGGLADGDWPQSLSAAGSPASAPG